MAELLDRIISEDCLIDNPSDALVEINQVQLEPDGSCQNERSQLERIHSSVPVVLERLALQLEIDPRLFLNPKELTDTKDLIKNKAEFLDKIPKKVQSVQRFLEIWLAAKSKLPEIMLTLNTQCALIYRLACWSSAGLINDEWKLDPSTHKTIKGVLDTLWELPFPKDYEFNGVHKNVSKNIHLARHVLSEHIKPLFTQDSSFSRKVNPITGRKLENDHAHLFGTCAPSCDDTQIWKIQGIGFWNALCDLLNRIHLDPAFEEIWSLIIPPIITLLDETTPRYRLRGLQVSIGLVENTPQSLLRRTGIDLLLQQSFSTSLSLLNIPQTPDLLSCAFEANIKMIRCQFSASQKNKQDQAGRYYRLNKLLEESVFNVLAFGRMGDSRDKARIDAFIISCSIELTKELGIAVARYLGVIVPYACETLLSITPNQERWTTVMHLNELLISLSQSCDGFFFKWHSRVLVVFATCWLEWQSFIEDENCGELAIVGPDSQVERLEILRKSMKRTISSFLKYVTEDDSAHEAPSTADMIKKLQQTNPRLEQIFDARNLAD